MDLKIKSMPFSIPPSTCFWDLRYGCTPFYHYFLCFSHNKLLAAIWIEQACLVCETFVCQCLCLYSLLGFIFYVSFVGQAPIHFKVLIQTSPSLAFPPSPFQANKNVIFSLFCVSWGQYLFIYIFLFPTKRLSCQQDHIL